VLVEESVAIGLKFKVKIYTMKLKFFVTCLTLSLTIGNMMSQQTHERMALKLEYLLYLPDDYGSSTDFKWPLILFLHGAGERGDSLDKVKRHGPPKLVEEGKDFDFIIVSPQCPARQWWSPELLIRLLDEVTAKYRVDEDRIYVTGLSMGGFGTWELASKYPQRFAAAAPICGGGNPELAWNMRHIPVWVFHGAKDNVVSVSLSEAMVESLKKYNDKVKFTIYPEANHDSWTETYNNPELYSWFLQHSKYKPEPVTIDKKLLESVCGEYDFLYDDRILNITTNGTDLFAEGNEKIKLRLYPESKYEYLVQGRNEGIKFQSDDKGDVTGLVYFRNGEMPARKNK
jgi:dienelactone hydrolase